MDVPLNYAIAAGGSIVLLLFIHSVTRLTRFLRPCRTLIRKYFLLLTLVGRHRFFGPWTVAQVSLQVVYLVANIFCASFRVSTVKEASVRAGHLSLFNIMPAYFGFHLSFICDLLGVSLATYRVFHASTGTISVLLGLLHVLIYATSKPSFNVGQLWQMFGLIVSAAVSNKSALLILFTGNRVYGLVTYPVAARISAAVVRSLPSLSLSVSGRRRLRPLETCPFSVETSPYLPAHLQLHICSYVRFRGCYYSISKCHCQSGLLASLDYETESRRPDDHLPRQTLESQSRTVRQRVDSVNRSFYFPVKPSVHHRLVERRTASLPRGLDRATERFHAKTPGLRR